VLFSILIPSRNRIKSLIETLKNISNTIRDFNTVEILVAIDNDDLSSQSKKEYILNEFNNLNINIYDKKHSDYLNKDYYNFLAEKSKGDYLFGIGDDVRFLTKNFNEILANKIETFLNNKKDRIAYISVNEHKSTAKHPCFPLITKEAFRVVREYHCSQLLSWGSDRILWEIYSHPSINRVLNVPEVSITHLSYHDGSAPFDATARSMKERFFRDPNCHNQISMYRVPQQRKIIENYIKEFNLNGMVS
jgi:hypothetical protein